MFDRFRPAELAAGVHAIDLENLWDRGIRGVVLDVDNTLCAWEWEVATVSGPVAAWVASAKRKGFRLCIISNGRPSRVAQIARTLGLPFVARAKKPLRKGFLIALEVLGTRPESTVMVGDQLLTDILGANRMGFHSILVPPVSSREFIGTKLNRLVEGVIRRGLGLPGAL